MLVYSALSLIRHSSIPLYGLRPLSTQPSSIIKFNDQEFELNKILKVGYYPKKIYWNYPWRLWIQYDKPHTYYQTILIPCGDVCIPYNYLVTNKTHTLEWKYETYDKCQKDYRKLNNKLLEFKKNIK